MKIYSDSIVSKTDLDAIDKKQSEQIAKLRQWCAILSVALIGNLLFSGYLLTHLR